MTYIRLQGAARAPARVPGVVLFLRGGGWGGGVRYNPAAALSFRSRTTLSCKAEGFKIKVGVYIRCEEFLTELLCCADEDYKDAVAAATAAAPRPTDRLLITLLII